MTVPQSRKSARRARWLSTGHGRARSDIKLTPQAARQFAAFDAICRSSISGFIVRQLAGAARPQSHTVSAAFKSP